MAKLNEIMLWKVVSICYKRFWQAFLAFFSRAFGFRRESFWLRHKSFFYCLH